VNVSELHNKAMDIAELAMIARLRGESRRVDELNRQAYEFEKQAAEIYGINSSEEPTRSVLYRSAASMALECGELKSAQKLIVAGLSGEPPIEIEDELKDLFEQVNFSRHLELRGVDLSPVEIQLAISGKSIGYGIAPADLFMDRITNTKILLRRTAERRRRMPFHERGKTADIIKQDSEMYISPLKAACLAVVLRVGQPKPQLPLFEEEGAVGLIDEFLYCLEAFNKGEDATLKQHIGDDAYYTNFIGLAHNIVPDGDQVNLVGFTAKRDGVERKVAITRRRDEIPAIEYADGTGEGEATKTEVVTGTLRFASALNTNTIKVQQENGKPQTIIVPEGLLNDIVKPMWNNTVAVEVSVKGKEMHLRSIREVEE
jgi:hypothetical protein